MLRVLDPSGRYCDPEEFDAWDACAARREALLARHYMVRTETLDRLGLPVDPGIRLLVCGGRDFADHELLDRVLLRIWRERGISVLIEGEQRGADRLAQLWASTKVGVPVLGFPADWTRYGKRAGPRRNALMLSEGRPEGCVAFPTPRSVGTWDMIRQAKGYGLTPWVIQG